jgi:aspartate/methionine/tyrosine aminotransferase
MKMLTRPLAGRVEGLATRDYPTGETAPEGAVSGAVQALDGGKTKYTNRPGIIPLRERIAEHVTADYGFAMGADNVTVTCGIAEAEFVALKYFTTHRDGAILTVNPDYLLPMGQLLGRSILDAPTNSVAAVFIDEQSNAAGVLLRHAMDTDIPVIWRGGPSNVPTAPAQTLVIGGGEPEMRGWRVGWMAGHQEHAKLRSYKQSMTICSPSISQWAALGMVEAQS